MRNAVASPIVPSVVAIAITGDAAFSAAQSRANLNGAPVCIWESPCAYYISEAPPDECEVAPEDYGYHLMAVVDPAHDARA